MIPRSRALSTDQVNANTNPLQVLAAINQQADVSTAADARVAVLLSQEEEYVMQLLKQDALKPVVQQQQLRVSLELLLSAKLSRCHGTTQLIDAQLRIEALEGTLQIPDDQRPWKGGQPAYEAAFKGLCAAKQLELQSEISYLVQTLLFVEALFQGLSTKRGDLKKLHKQKQLQRGRYAHDSPATLLQAARKYA